MAFNSYAFAVFFLAVIALYQLVPKWNGKKLVLLVASYVFYAGWDPRFLTLLWLSTGVDWIVAKRIVSSSEQAAKRRWLVISLVMNLGVLAFFKYADFFLSSLGAISTSLGFEYSPAPLHITLPVGISFYTFQTLSYTIDVYRGNLKPAKTLLDFALFVAFFPQLVAGPIVRAVDFLPQCEKQSRISMEDVGWGLSIIVIGLFQKVVLSDGILAPIADTVFDAPDAAGYLDAWVGALAFHGQIFFDFAGYSTCAIGCAVCLGFILPRNFMYPYGAVGFSDFWRRWHISLSVWLRDYLYISLGGNRTGRMRTYINLMLTMLLGGLWHGASWRFVVWGGLHGLYLVVERMLQANEKRTGLDHSENPFRVVGRAMVTNVLVLLTWIFFRATDFGNAFTLIKRMFINDSLTQVFPLDGPGAPYQIEQIAAFVVGCLLITWHVVFHNRAPENVWRQASVPKRAAALALMIFLISTSSEEGRAFIYFQF